MKGPLHLKSIKTRALAALLLAGLLPILLISVSTMALMRQALLESEYDKMSGLCDEVSRAIDVRMQYFASSIKALVSHLSYAAEGERADNVKDLMGQIEQFYGHYLEVTLYTDYGNVVESTTYEFWEDPSHQTHFFKSALQGDTIVSKPHKLIDMEGLFISVYAPVPVRDSDKPFVLNARISFDEIWEALDVVSLGEGGYLQLLDHRGNILSHPDRSLILTKHDDASPQKYWQQAAQGAYKPPGGKPFHYASKSLQPVGRKANEPWTLLAMKPESEVLSLLHQAQIVLSLVAVLTVCGICILGGFLSRRLSAPITQAALVAERVGEGDLGQRISVEGAEEVRKLAMAFNKMVEELSDHRTRLESLVEKRTQNLRESEKALQRVASQLSHTHDAIEDGLLVVDVKDRSVVTANRVMGELFEFDADTRGDEKSISPFEQIGTCWKQPERFERLWNQFSEHPEDAGVEELVMSHPQLRTIAVHTAPVKTPEGEIFARLWRFRDLTTERQLEEQLLQMSKLDAIGKLAGGIAHNFNNLIQVIRGHAELLQSSMPKEDLAYEDLQVIIQASQKGADLTQQLLGFSRQQQFEREFVALDFAVLVDDTIDMLTHLIPENIEIRVMCDDRLAAVFGDRHQIEQVLLNLCINARDAMPDGGLILVSAKAVDLDQSVSKAYSWAKAGKYIELKITDTGEGIPKEIEDRIFEPFFTTKEVGKGTGLGLSMVYGIVRQHEGIVEVHNVPDGGAEFRICFPTCEDKPKAAQVVPQKVSRTGTETILVAEDDDHLRKLLSRVLDRAGYKTLICRDGQEAVDLFHANAKEISLSLLDVIMPRMTGREVYQNIIKEKPDMHVLFTSGYSMAALNEDFIESEGLEFLNKPYDLDVLLSRIRSMLG